MKISRLSEYLDKLDKTSSRIEMTKILAELFREAGSDEIDKISYLILGQLAPNYKGIVFNLAEQMMLRVLASSYETNIQEVKKLYKEIGDLGEVARELGKNEGKSKRGEMPVGSVYERLTEVAEDEGEKSQERKVQAMAKLLSEIDPQSAKFVARMPVGKLRLGFSDKTILDALSWMEAGDKSKKAKLEKAYQVIPDVGLLARKVKEVGIDKASVGIKPIIGVPVLPMLAQRIKSPAEMIEKMGKVAVEPKFDGLRVLIHFKRNPTSRKASRGKEGSDFVKAFTRNLNNVADMFPELKEVGKYLKADEVILDTEAVGMDPEMLYIANFQTTMKRRRKYDIEENSRNIPLRFQTFDIIFRDGKSLMDLPYTERRKILNEVVVKNNLLVVDNYLITDDPEVINGEYRKKIEEGLEGVMIKKADSGYVPGRTGWRWVKMKQEETSSAKLADTVDCVVMGYYAGRGKRTQFGLGGFLVGVRVSVKGEDLIQTVTKIGTGLTDEQFREMKIRLKKLEVRDKPKEYGEVGNTLIPDVWVTPSLVVEIAADEITKSPIHSAGYALRFPRLVKFRDDKSWDEATTIGELKKLFKIQKS